MGDLAFGLNQVLFVIDTQTNKIVHRESPIQCTLCSYPFLLLLERIPDRTRYDQHTLEPVKRY